MEAETKVINGVLHYKGTDPDLMEGRWFPVKYLEYKEILNET